MGRGLVIGKRAPEFTLPDQYGNDFDLYKTLTQSAVLLIFYPGDFRIVCKKQLCDYRDHLKTFYTNGVQLVGISADPMEQHLKFAQEFGFPFPLLTDSNHSIAKLYNCTSLLLFGQVSRAVYVVNRQGVILYCYVEHTHITHKTASLLSKIILDLKENKLI